MTRNEARWKIIQAANVWKLRRKSFFGLRFPGETTLFGMRQLQQAVCTVRRHKLVKPEILEAAGFNAKRT